MYILLGRMLYKLESKYKFSRWESPQSFLTFEDAEEFLFDHWEEIQIAGVNFDPGSFMNPYVAIVEFYFDENISTTYYFHQDGLKMGGDYWVFDPLANSY